MVQTLFCVHNWSPEVSTGTVDMKHCPRCQSWWIADPDHGFTNEPKMAIGILE